MRGAGLLTACAAAQSLLILTVGCASAPAPIGDAFAAPSRDATILVMPPQVSVTFVTVDAIEERADWSAQAEANLMRALTAELAASGETVVMYAPDDPISEEAHQALLLAETVTDALAAHVVFRDARTFQGALAHQGPEVFPYTLGEGVRAFAPQGGADYALFLTSRSTIESGAMYWTKALAGAATGFALQSSQVEGAQLALVDLNTGEVVWLQGVTSGDARDADDAADMIAALWRSGPLAQP